MPSGQSPTRRGTARSDTPARILTKSQNFSPNASLETVTHAQLNQFLTEMITVLRAESSALLTVGSAAIKWGSAWKNLDVDYYSLHFYDWVYEWFPYQSVTPASVGLTGKPVVMGEYPFKGLSAFPAKGLPARTNAQFVEDLYQLGYAGALGWALNDAAFPFDASATKSFADMHSCQARF